MIPVCFAGTSVRQAHSLGELFLKSRDMTLLIVNIDALSSHTSYTALLFDTFCKLTSVPTVCASAQMIQEVTCWGCKRKAYATAVSCHLPIQPKSREMLLWALFYANQPFGNRTFVLLCSSDTKIFLTLKCHESLLSVDAFQVSFFQYKWVARDQLMKMLEHFT